MQVKNHGFVKFSHDVTQLTTTTVLLESFYKKQLETTAAELQIILKDL